MIDIGLTVVFHREGAFAVPALASMADMASRTAAAGVRVETRAILDRPDHDTQRIVHKLGDWLDDIVTVDFGDLGASRNEGTRLSSCSHLAFLDGDDMWGADWLVKASASAFAAGWPNDVVWHPEWLYYFDERDFDCHTAGGLPRRGARSFLMTHVSSDSPELDRRALLMNNFWTANVFASRSLHERFPYREIDRSSGFGIEDWSWNIETLSAGVRHDVVPDSVHLIRVKQSGSLGQQNGADGLLPAIPDECTSWFGEAIETVAMEPAMLPLRRAA
jgi:hypothetical protein